MTSAAPPLTKDSLRKAALILRGQLLPDERIKASHAIQRHLLPAISFNDATVIAGYWPIKGEIDVRPFLKECARRGARTALPQVSEHRKPLAFRLWEEGDPVIQGRYGIMEPDPASCTSHLPDIVLVPLLAFDARGHRLGYGSGFYDRTFASFREAKHDFLAVGVAFEAQKLEIVPSGTYDYRMDMIVTEKALYKFKGQPSS